jgi:hypothetical protein
MNQPKSNCCGAPIIDPYFACSKCGCYAGSDTPKPSWEDRLDDLGILTQNPMSYSVMAGNRTVEVDYDKLRDFINSELSSVRLAAIQSCLEVIGGEKELYVDGTLDRMIDNSYTYGFNAARSTIKQAIEKLKCG